MVNRIKGKITKKGIITTTVIVFIFVMSLGYAALSQHMDIDGVAQVDRSWIIKVTNVTSAVTNGGVDKSKTYVGTTVTMNASLPTSTSTVKYTITLQNQGNLSAKLNNVEKVEDENTSITYEMTGALYGASGASLLEPGATMTVTVTIKYQSGVTSASNIDKSLMLSFDFVESRPSSGGSWIEGPTSTNHATYKKGDMVTLKDGSIWQVTKDSSGVDDLVTLAATKVLNSNGGFATSESNAYKKAFDTGGSNQYNPKSTLNIGHFIDNVFLPQMKATLASKSGTDTTGMTARLITEDELSMRIMSGCSSSKAGHCHIYATYAGIGYWTMSPSGSSNVVIHDVDKGPYSGTAAPTATTYTILPVITLKKSNIRTVDFGNRIAYVDNRVQNESDIDLTKPNVTGREYTIKTADPSTASFTASTTYYFSTSYKFDPSTGRYTLGGTTKSGTWSSMSTEFATYPYTCKNTTETATCSTLYKMTSYTSTTAGIGYQMTSIAAGTTYRQTGPYTTTISVTGNEGYSLGTSYTFDSTTGQYTVISDGNAVWSEFFKGTYSYFDVGYTCRATRSTCRTLYAIDTSTATNGSSPYAATYYHTSINGSTSGSNNGEGVYQNFDDIGRTSYFRGNVTNNYVKFANKFWRIIRVNGDGSVRLIYQGTSANATGSDTMIGTTAFNGTSASSLGLKHVGYMYGSDASPYENINSSTAKSKIDTWYNSNLSSYSSYLATSTFCSDRSMVSEAGLYYGFCDRLSGTPTFKCSQSTDRLSLSAGLITADEAKFAGLGGGVRENYLYTNVNEWTMTPYTATQTGSSYNVTIVFLGEGAISTGLPAYSTVAYVRPVINLKTAVKTITGNGTSSNPYVIS